MTNKHSRRGIQDPDCPELTDQQLRSMRRATPSETEYFRQAIENTTGKSRTRRIGRPHKYPGSKLQDIHIKLHPAIVGWAKREAKKRHIGYQSFLNDFLLGYANAA